MSDPLAPPTAEEPMPSEVFMGITAGAGPRPSWSEDLVQAPPAFWQDAESQFLSGGLSTDDYYTLHRQRAEDDANPMLADIRASKAAASVNTQPLASGQPGAPLDAQPPMTLETGAVPAGTPNAAAVQPQTPSTAEQVGGFLASIGLTGIQPLQPAGGLVEALYGQDPSKDTNPVYITASRLAAGLDMALTALNVPITGIGDVANVLFAPLTVGLQAAGFSKETVAAWVAGTQLVPELAAGFGMGAGAVGTLGKVGNLTGLGAELAPIMARAGRVMKLEESFSATVQGLRSQRGEMATPGGPPPTALLPDTPETLAAKYAADVVEARRGGPRTHEQVQAEAQALIDSGLVSMDTVQQILPGTALADAQAVAVVKTLAESGLRLKALAQKAVETADPADVQAVMQQLYLHGAVDPKRIGITTEAGRTLSAMNEPTSGLNRFLVQFEELLRNQTSGADPMAMVQSIADLKDPGQLAVLARQAAKPGFWDMFKEYYVNGLLWGPKTWMANTLGNTATTAWSIPERSIAGLFGRGEGVVAGEGTELILGVLGSQADAWRLASEAFQAGESQFSRVYGATDIAGVVARGSDKFELPHRAITAETLELTGTAGQAVDFLGTVIRFPMRVLASTDDYFKVINFQAELRALAFRQASHEVAAEGLTGKAASQAVAERQRQLMADPPVSIKRAADAHALYQTFTKELGDTGQALQKLSNTTGGKIVMPFVRTPINIFKYATERTPLGLLMSEVRRDLFGPDVAKAQMARAKMALGSTTMALAGMLAYNGNITGGGPKDPTLQKQLRALGWQPYSLRIGDKYYSYSRVEPVGMLLGLAADWTDAMVNSEGNTWLAWSGEAAASVVTAVAKNFTSRTFVKGVADTMAALADPERAAQSRTSGFLVGLLPASGLIRQTEAANDPTMAEAQGVMEKVQAQIPGLSSSLPVRRDLFGDPLYMTGVYGPVGVSTLKNDAVLRELVRVKARVPDIPHFVEGNIEVFAEERDYWAIQRGKMKDGSGKDLHATLADTMQRDEYKQASKDHKAFLLELDIKHFQNEARVLLDKEYPVIRRSSEKALDDKAKARTKPEAPGDLSPLLKSLMP